MVKGQLEKAVQYIINNYPQYDSDWFNTPHDALNTDEVLKGVVEQLAILTQKIEEIQKHLNTKDSETPT